MYSMYNYVHYYFLEGLCKFKLDNHLGVVRCLCLTEGNRLVSGGDRKRICVWDIKVGVVSVHMVALVTILFSI